MNSCSLSCTNMNGFTAVSHNIEVLRVENMAEVIPYLKLSKIRLALKPKRSCSLSGDSPLLRLGRDFLSEQLDEINRTSKVESPPPPKMTLSCEQQWVTACTKDWGFFSQSYVDAYLPRGVTASCRDVLFVTETSDTVEMRLSCHENSHRFPDH